MACFPQQCRDWLRRPALRLATTLILVLAVRYGSPQGVLPEAPGDVQTARSVASRSGALSGTVTDRDGALIAGARVQVSMAGVADVQATESGSDGHFLLAPVPAGSYEVTISSPGQTPTLLRGTLHEGETVDLAQIALAPAGSRADVQVYATREELAEAELKLEETQRIGGFIPNFYVVYDWKAPPLSTRQKYDLALRTIADPVTFLLNGVSAGIEQAQDTFPGYGQGAAGYGRRFGANYGDVISGTILGGALLPQIFHQDPRYFYKGSGGVRRRLLYALGTTVVCRGDNGKWQPCYSAVLGDLASGAISNAYYPASDRHGAALTFEQGLLSVGLDGIGNVIQEFLIRHLTPHPPTYSSTGP